MTMKYLSLLLLAATAAPLAAQTPPPPPPAEAKVSAMPYVMAAGMSDLYEINSSQVALQKSQTPAIRKFATMLISINELQTASASDFDRLYIGQQIPAHQAALDLHRSYSTGGDQAPLRASAKTAVPIVQQHLNAAMKLQSGKSMGGMSGM
jgi:putative membrane protein